MQEHGTGTNNDVDDTYSDGPFFNLDLTAPEQNTKQKERQQSSLSKSAAKIRFFILKLKKKPNSVETTALRAEKESKKQIRNVVAVKSHFQIVYQRKRTLLELLLNEEPFSNEVEKKKRKSLKQGKLTERSSVIVCMCSVKRGSKPSVAGRAERREDETHQQDGIRSAILYCKRSFNESSEGMQGGEIEEL